VSDVASAMQNGRPARGQRLSQQRLARTGGPDQEDIRLLELDVVSGAPRIDPLVVVVDGDREDLLGPLLADDVLVEGVLDVTRRGSFSAAGFWRAARGALPR